MLYFSALSYLLSIFPIFITLNLYYDQKNARLNFSIILLGCVKIVGGYIKRNGTKIIIHVSDSRAFIFDLTKLKPGSGIIKNIFSLELVDLNILKIFPYDVSSISTATTISTFESVLVPVWKSIKDFVRYRSNTHIVGDQTRLIMNATLMFNFVVIGNIILRIIIKKVFNK